MALDGSRAELVFGEEFNGRAEEVVEQAPFVAVEIIQQSNDLGLIETGITDPLADMGPVFLFDVGVVIFAVGSAACKADRVRAVQEMAHEMVVEEFRAVVTVKAEDGKRERLFDVTELL